MNVCVIRRSGCCADWRDRPENSLRYVAMVIWLYSAFRGVQLTTSTPCFSSILRRLPPVILWSFPGMAAAG